MAAKVRAWARRRELHRVSYLGIVAKNFGLSLTVFPGTSTGCRKEEQQPGLKPVPIWDTGIAGNGLTHYTTTPAHIFAVLTVTSMFSNLKLAALFLCGSREALQKGQECTFTILNCYTFLPIIVPSAIELTYSYSVIKPVFLQEISNFKVYSLFLHLKSTFSRLL